MTTEHTRVRPALDGAAMSLPGAGRVAGWLFWVVFPLLATVALILAMIALISHAGRSPAGVHGEFIGGRHCAHSVCLVTGTFTSDDGTVVEKNLLGDPRWKSGEPHNVIYDRKSAEVSDIAHWNYATSVLAAVGALTYLGYVARVGWVRRAAGRSRTR